MSNSSDTFDYIIIGGGSSGSILTNRLSSNGATVCLIEAGPKDTNPYIHIPAGYIKNIFSKSLHGIFFQNHLLIQTFDHFLYHKVAFLVDQAQ